NLCSVPTGETTHSVGWDATFHDFQQTLTSSGGSFVGRSVQEADFGGGPDTCWFPGSAIPKQVHLSGGTWPVTSGNQWGNDTLGWPSIDIAYYRTLGRASPSCGTSLRQQMQISCDGGWANYGPVNTLILKFTPITVTNSRAGVAATRRW